MGRTSALAATVACAFALIFSASASADLRTAWQANKYPEEGQCPPTIPKLRDAQLRLDTTTGRLDVTINFEEPLADPAVTSALRPWRAEVVLGDWMTHGTCLGNDDSWLRVDAAIGDDQPGLIDRWGDYQDQFDALEVTKAFAADRSALTLSVTAPALTAQTVICASIEIRPATTARSNVTSPARSGSSSTASRLPTARSNAKPPRICASRRTGSTAAGRPGARATASARSNSAVGRGTPPGWPARSRPAWPTSPESRRSLCTATSS